jgi:hypothetical protein
LGICIGYVFDTICAGDIPDMYPVSMEEFTLKKEKLDTGGHSPVE